MENGLLFLFIFSLSLGLTVIILQRIIPKFKRIAAQPIYEEGPAWHIKKNGTPTMGGIGFIIPILLSLFPLALFLINNGDTKRKGISLLICLVFSLSNAFIGLFDDLCKLYHKRNKGLSPLQKILLQSLSAIIFLISRRYYFNDATTLDFSFGSIDIGFLYYPLAMIILLGSINCANLTDGIDGLSSSVALVCGIFFAFVSFSHFSELNIVAFVLIGAMLGFLLFNANPAKIFMGDTGSLFLGAFIVSLCFLVGNPLIILFIGIVYVVEGVSVILQVTVYKLRKKRVFKMAPLHHHLEKSGYSENKICVIAIIITAIFSIICPMVLRI